MKILQLCYKMPFPVLDGGSYAVYYSARAMLENKYEVKVLAVNTPRAWVDNNLVPDGFCRETRFESVRIDTRLHIHKALLNLLSTRSYFITRFYSRAFAERLEKLLQEETFDIIQLEHLYMGIYLGIIRQHTDAKVVLRAQNVEHLLWERILQLKKNPFELCFLKIAVRRLRRFECNIAGKLDAIMAISDRDAGFFRSVCSSTLIDCIQPGYDFSKLLPENPIIDDKAPPAFYHIGSMDWQPNLQGIRWFIEEILPYLQIQCPGFRIHLAGKKMPAWLLHSPIRALIADGEVSDTIQYIRDKHVMVVPLISGGGIRVKIIEAMAAGKAVISTTIGAEGIPYTHGVNILIADTREEFARHVGNCMASRDYCNRIGAEAGRLAREHYDLTSVSRRSDAFYKKVLENKPVNV